MFRMDLRHKAMTTKAKVNPGEGDTSELLASHGRERVSIATNLDILNGIVHRGKDPRGMGHHSPNYQWDSHRRSSFPLTPAWAKGTSVSSRVLHKHLLIYKRATWTRGWVEVKGMAHKPGLLAKRGR